MLAPILLIDRAPGRRFTAPLVGVILAAGQFSDLTVRYVAVPAIVVVCLYRVLAARKLRSADLAIAVAAVLSVPVEAAFRAVMTWLGAFYMVAPKAKLASPRLWPQHISITWLDIRVLFGAVASQHARLGGARPGTRPYHRQADGRRRGRRDDCDRVADAIRRGRPPSADLGHRAAVGVARGARAPLRRRRLLGCVDHHRGVRQQGTAARHRPASAP